MLKSQRAAAGKRNAGQGHAAGIVCRPQQTFYFVIDELLDEPLGLVDDDELPPVPLLEDEPPLGLDGIEPPLVLDEPPLMPLLVLPVPPLLELESGVPGVLDEEEDEPPGTTTVSFDVLLLEPDAGGVLLLLPPGTTVVVSFFSHAPSANAARRTIKYPLRFMSTPFSFCV